MYRIKPRILVALGALVFVYFVIYPEDVNAVIAPIAPILGLSLIIFALWVIVF